MAKALVLLLSCHPHLSVSRMTPLMPGHMGST